MTCNARSDRPDDLLSRRAFAFLVYLLAVAAPVLAGKLPVIAAWIAGCRAGPATHATP